MDQHHLLNIVQFTVPAIGLCALLYLQAMALSRHREQSFLWLTISSVLSLLCMVATLGPFLFPSFCPLGPTFFPAIVLVTVCQCFLNIYGTARLFRDYRRLAESVAAPRPV